MNILLVEDEALWRKVLTSQIRKYGKLTHASSQEEALNLIKVKKFDLMFADLDLGKKRLEGANVVKAGKRKNIFTIVLTTQDDDETVDHLLDSCKADNYFVKPDNLEVVNSQVKDMFDSYKKKSREDDVAQLIGSSIFTNDGNYLNRIFNKIKRIDQGTNCVLVVGETGTGKTRIVSKVISKLIDPNKEVLRVDCGSFPENLIDSELFGHVKGAFTGANTDKSGLFENAKGKILFLDDIQNLTTKGQQNLRTIRDEGFYFPVGSTKIKKYVNSPIIFAGTNELDEKVKDGTFRKDIYERISGLRINTKPIRERKEDIIPMIKHFAKENYPRGMVFRLSEETKEILENYSWRGNTREIENCVQTWCLQGIQKVKKSDLDERFVMETESKDNNFFEISSSQFNYILENGFKDFIAKMRVSAMKKVLSNYPSDTNAARATKLDRSVVYSYRKQLTEE